MRVPRLAVSICRISDGDILELPHHRVHSFLALTAGERSIQYLPLLRAQKSLERLNHRGRILLGPKVDIQCVQPELVLALITRVGTGQAPVVGIYRWRGGCAIRARLVWVDDQRQESWELVGGSQMYGVKTLSDVSWLMRLEHPPLTALESILLWCSGIVGDFQPDRLAAGIMIEVEV